MNAANLFSRNLRLNLTQHWKFTKNVDESYSTDGRGGGGQVVSKLAFYSDDMGSKPAGD